MAQVPVTAIASISEASSPSPIQRGRVSDTTTLLAYLGSLSDRRMCEDIEASLQRSVQSLSLYMGIYPTTEMPRFIKSSGVRNRGWCTTSVPSSGPEGTTSFSLEI